MAVAVDVISVAYKGEPVTILTKTPALKSGNTPSAKSGIVYQLPHRRRRIAEVVN